MKSLKLFITVIALILMPISGFGQDTFSRTASELTFENSSEERFIETYVTEGVLSLHFKVNSQLKKGSLAVEITYAETGENFGSFSIGSSAPKGKQEKPSVKENVISDINKVLNSPKQGYYRIKISAKNANAQIVVTVEQYSS